MKTERSNNLPIMSFFTKTKYTAEVDINDNKSIVIEFEAPRHESQLKLQQYAIEAVRKQHFIFGLYRSDVRYVTEIK